MGRRGWEPREGWLHLEHPWKQLAQYRHDALCTDVSWGESEERRDTYHEEPTRCKQCIGDDDDCVLQAQRGNARACVVHNSPGHRTWVDCETQEQELERAERRQSWTTVDVQAGEDGGHGSKPRMSVPRVRAHSCLMAGQRQRRNGTGSAKRGLFKLDNPHTRGKGGGACSRQQA